MIDTKTETGTLTGNWRLNTAVQWRRWNGETVAYNGRTGDTHHFVDVAGWAFSKLCDGSVSATSLTREAGETLELADDDTAGTVARTLALFDRLELIERVA